MKATPCNWVKMVLGRGPATLLPIINIEVQIGECTVFIAARFWSRGSTHGWAVGECCPGSKAMPLCTHPDRACDRRVVYILGADIDKAWQTSINKSNRKILVLTQPQENVSTRVTRPGTYIRPGNLVDPAPT